MESYRQLALEIYAAALAAVQGEQAVYRTLIASGFHTPCHVIAIGKAAEAMFRGAWRYWQSVPGALLISKYGHVSQATRALPAVEVLEAGHPVPDAASLHAGQRLVDYLQGLPDQVPVLFLVSGGTSSLVEVLAEGWELATLQASTQQMLADGSTIHDMNAIRRELSCIKGGKLWQAVGNRPVSCLLMSDVPGDDPAVIGSGLLFPPPAQATLHWELAASNARMLAALAARDWGLPLHIMPAFLQGDAASAAADCMAVLRASPPGIYVWGGETVVQLPDDPGQGGRNQQFALAAALQLQAGERLCLLAAGTDGTDGMSEEAGALVDAGSVQRGQQEGLDARDCLQRADAGTFLAASGDLIHTGPTGTNVMDIVIACKAGSQTDAQTATVES